MKRRKTREELFDAKAYWLVPGWGCSPIGPISSRDIQGIVSEWTAEGINGDSIIDFDIDQIAEYLTANDFADEIADALRDGQKFEAENTKRIERNIRRRNRNHLNRLGIN